MKAIDYLKQLKKLDMMISNKLIEVEQWKAIASGTTAQMGGDRVQTSSSQQKMADAVCRYIDLEHDINRSIDRLVNKRKEIIGVIEQLNAVEYDVLHRHYVQYQDLREIADAYSRSYSWATSVHGTALVNVGKVLDEREVVNES